MIEFFRRRAKALRPEAGQIPAGAIQFHPSSYADPHGRVFFAGGKLYRGVAAENAAFCARLLDTGVVADLVKKQLLVPTVRSPLKADGFALVLEHARIPYVSYPFEWPGEMLRAAALHTLDLLEDLAGRGLTLKDAHGWNVLFEGCRPVFVDFGSMVEATPGMAWRPNVEQEFLEYFLYPLELMAAGHWRIVRTLLRDFERGISIDVCASIAGMAISPRPEAAQSTPFAWYRERIRSLKLCPASTGWSAYYDGHFPALTPDSNWTPKHHAIHRLLQEHRPASVLDIGANRGWYAMLAAKEGARAVAFDNDEHCINQLYADAVQGGHDVQPLVMSCVYPSPRYGLGSGLVESAVERLQSDLVLGLALVHHLVFKMHLNFDQIAAGLAAYARKTLIVEFPPHDDIHVKQWMTERHAWYTVENFTRALRPHFPKISHVASHPDPRILLVCER